MNNFTHEDPATRRPGRPAKTVQSERAGEPVHPTRNYETYTEEDLHTSESTPWVRPSSLEAPPPRKGFRQRWIRVGSQGQPDPTNTARKFREGWRPRPSESIPTGFHAPTISHGQWAGCVGVEGMLLCEMPEKMAQRRDAHYQGKTDLVTNTIESDLQQHSHPLMPISQERKSRVVRNVAPMEDQ